MSSYIGVPIPERVMISNQGNNTRNIAGWDNKNQNMFGVLVRLNDKIQRLANLLEKEKNGENPQVENEKLSDTAQDICNYGAILELLVTNRWK